MGVAALTPVDCQGVRAPGGQLSAGGGDVKVDDVRTSFAVCVAKHARGNVDREDIVAGLADMSLTAREEEMGHTHR